MPLNIVEIPIYQIGSRNYDNEPGFRVFRYFPSKGIFAQDVSAPMNSARGVLCYGRIQTNTTGDNVYYTSLTMAQIIEAVNIVEAEGIGSAAIGSTFIIG
jgi:hypothetical protein